MVEASACTISALRRPKGVRPRSWAADQKPKHYRAWGWGFPSSPVPLPGALHFAVYLLGGEADLLDRRREGGDGVPPPLWLLTGQQLGMK